MIYLKLKNSNEQDKIGGITYIIIYIIKNNEIKGEKNDIHRGIIDKL